MLTYIEDARIQAELIVEEGLGNAYNSGMEEGLAKGCRASSRAKIASSFAAQLLEASRIDDVAGGFVQPAPPQRALSEFDEIGGIRWWEVVLNGLLRRHFCLSIASFYGIMPVETTCLSAMLAS
ncbi:MAG: hypothetical protein ACLUW6_06110 [Coriobacteriaceae bacterium]